MTDVHVGPAVQRPARVQESATKISDIEKTIGSATEFHDLARFSLAKWILGVLAALTFTTLACLMFAPEGRLAAMMDFFAFVKASVPPLVTLVAGFYFGQTAKQG